MFSFGLILNFIFAVLMSYIALQNFLVGNYGFAMLDILCAGLNSFAVIKIYEHHKQLKKEQE